jgi:hypothetical protein
MVIRLLYGDCFCLYMCTCVHSMAVAFAELVKCSFALQFHFAWLPAKQYMCRYIWLETVLFVVSFKGGFSDHAEQCFACVLMHKAEPFV